MTRIHWIGTGLSAIPGLRRLIDAGHPVTVWNRTVEKAQEAVGDIATDIRPFTPEALGAALSEGDVVVSMLPATWHVPLAELAIAHRAHFVSSSFIAPEMRALDAAAQAAGVCLVNEIGLDPGIDHLMAHRLIADYRASAAFDPLNALSFLSYCGGIPKHPNPMKYKFSWSPLGVLKALRSPSRALKDGEARNVARPWDALGQFTAPLPTPETFEVYPNRDSLPFMADYKFDPEWNTRDFVRGTLRLAGWAEAWKDLFAEIETLEGAAGEARLQDMSDHLWAENQYEPGEPDRVVLCVSLEAKRDGAAVYHKTYVMDAWGDARGSAMARLVSTPVSWAVESTLAGELPAGVTAAPDDLAIVGRYLDGVGELAQHLEMVDHLAG